MNRGFDSPAPEREHWPRWSDLQLALTAVVLSVLVTLLAAFAASGRRLPFESEPTTTVLAAPPSATSTTMAPTTTTTTSTTTSTTLPIPSPEDVAVVLATDDWYIDPAASVDSTALGEAVLEMAVQGEVLGVVVLASEPEIGAAGFADEVYRRVGHGLVLVVAAESVGVGGSSARFTPPALDAALDAAAAAPIETDAVLAFVDSLTGGGGDGGGGGDTSTTMPQTSTTVPGDLGLSVPMTRPECDGSYAVFIGASVDPSRNTADMERFLSANPGAKYLRTDQSCQSLRQRTPSGQVIYAAFLGPYATQTEACTALANAPSGAYIKPLDNTSNPDTIPNC